MKHYVASEDGGITFYTGLTGIDTTDIINIADFGILDTWPVMAHMYSNISYDIVLYEVIMGEDGLPTALMEDTQTYDLIPCSVVKSRHRINGVFAEVGDTVTHTDGRVGTLNTSIMKGDTQVVVTETFGTQGDPHPELPWNVSDITAIAKVGI